MKIFSAIRAAAAGATLGFRAAFGAYQEATSFGPDRGGVAIIMPSDTRSYVDSWTRKEIRRRVEWVFQNFGVMKEAVRGIARLTVQRGICLSINTDDETWNAAAEADFEAWAMSPNRCDLSGRRNFYEIQAHAIEMRIKQGEFLAAFVKNPRWEDEPCLQIFDGQEIDTPNDRQSDARVFDGVELDANHCPVRYFVCREDGSTPIPASEFVHWFHGDSTNQVRGISDLAQAIAPTQDAKELIRIVTKTAKQQTAFGLHVKKAVKKGGQGALDQIRTLSQRAKVAAGEATPPGSEKTPPSQDNDAAYERVAGGGGIVYTDADGDVRFVTPSSPTPLLEPFITKVLLRDGFASVGAPAELFWDCSNLNSANQRFVLLKGDVLFTHLGDGLIGHLLNPAAVRFLVHRMEQGKLEKPRIRLVDPETGKETWQPDTEGRWMSALVWQLPQRMSIDNGRDANAEIAQLDKGIENLASVNDRRGRGWRPMTRQWFREFAYAELCAKEFKVEWALKLWRAAMPGAAGASPTATEDRLTELEEKKTPEEQKPAPSPDKKS